MAESKRTVVITGVTRGLGRALVSEFIEHHNCCVWGCGRNRDQITELNREFAGKGRFRPLDVTSSEEVDSWAAEFFTDHKYPDLLINNAGLINRNAPLWEVPEEEFRQVIEVNLLGIANMVRAFVPSMVRTGKGVVANLSSTWGRSTSAEVAPYCATKWGVEGLTKSLSQEVPPGVAAVTVNPGVIDTDMLRSCFGGGAGFYPKASEWAGGAARFFMTLDETDNGKSLTVS